MQRTALIEYGHRLTASVVGFLVLALAIVAWLKYRSVGPVFWPSFLALVTVVVQAGVGRQVVLGELQGGLVVFHFFLSLALVGLLTLATVNSFSPRGGGLDKISRHALIAAGAGFVVLMVGATVVQKSAGLAFPDWPLMNGSLLPPGGGRPVLQYLHRLLAALLGITLAHLALRITRRQPRDRTLLMLGHSTFALWILQVLIGGAAVLTELASWTRVAHVLTGELLWAALVALAAWSYRRAGVTGKARPVIHPPASSTRSKEATGRIKAYFLLTKPRIIELLLITTVPAMIVAKRGWPSPGLVLATLIGGSLAAGSANAINCYLDRDIDEKMGRTSIRPLPRHEVRPSSALRFGMVLGVASLGFMTLTVNFAAAALAFSAILFYVFVYTIGLKRSTPSNIVIGGAAGAAPALVGWAAVTGSLARPAWVMFAIIFYWTPPHFWALALKYADEYEAAGVPMLPVVRGAAETAFQILLYAGMLFAVSLLLYPVARLGVLYLSASLVLGVGFIYHALRLRSRGEVSGAMRLFHFSISYLVLLFVALAADRLLGVPAIPSIYQPVLVFAATLFILFESAILVRLVAYPRPAASGRLRVLAFEILWTVIPLIMMGSLFLVSWGSSTLN